MPDEDLVVTDEEVEDARERVDLKRIEAIEARAAFEVSQRSNDNAVRLAALNAEENRLEGEIQQYENLGGTVRSAAEATMAQLREGTSPDAADAAGEAVVTLNDEGVIVTTGTVEETSTDDGTVVYTDPREV